MRLIVGLGNIGERYCGTRHNTGFLVVEALANDLGGNSTDWKTKRGKTCQVYFAPGRQLLLAKPQTLMNESGAAVGALVNQERVPVSDLLIVHDDLDLPLGTFRLQKDRGAAGHKGIQSIIDVLASKEFWRLRVGIGRPSAGVAAEDYVLGKFSKNELEVIERLVEDELVEVVRDWVDKGTINY